VPHHLALGTYVVFEGDTEYARRCFREYAMLPDTSGKYAALYRPIHMIGLELGISVASCALRNEPTGAPTGFVPTCGDCQTGVESGRKCWTARAASASGATDAGRCVASRTNCCRLGWRTTSSSSATFPEGGALKWSDVVYDANDFAVKVRREMEAAFGRRNVRAEAVL